jgi:hypothetical protein
VVPQPADSIWFSADGKSWRRLETTAVSGTTSAVVLEDMGYYEAGAAAAAGGAGAPSDLARTGAVAGVTAVLALGLWLVPAAVRRRRPGRRPGRKAGKARG